MGESVKTAQALLGHSDLETTLNIYMHAIPDSQRRAVERVAGVLFPDVPNFNRTRKSPVESTDCVAFAYGEEVGEPRRTRTYNPLIKSQLLYH